jgi:hypothetical protein
MNGFATITEVLRQAIADLEKNHINPLKNDEKGLSIARVTNDSVAFTSAGASLAFPIAAIPCLATTIVASLSILGTAMADSIIHSMAESRINDFMNKLKIKLNDVVIEELNQALILIKYRIKCMLHQTFLVHWPISFLYQLKLLNMLDLL